MLGYRGHFLTKSRAYSVTFAQLAPAPHRLPPRRSTTPTARPTPGAAPSMTAWSWSTATWIYAGTGHATTGQHALALAAAARAREHEQAAREESRVA